METFDLESYVRRSRALDLSGLAWEEVPSYPLSPETIRTLRYMQDIESHTIVYLRTLLSTRAIDDPEVATFLACWLYELTTLTGYQRLTSVAGHPVLADLLARIIRDESRHFFFYFRQAARRLRSPRAARITRFLVDHHWAPVGSGVQPESETRFLATFLFSDAEGRKAAARVDDHIRRLPGFADVRLLEAWIDRETGQHPPSFEDGPLAGAHA